MPMRMTNRRLQRTMSGVATATAVTLGLILLAPAAISAQRGRGGASAPAQAPQAAAPIDLTGYWVSIVTEDWRWRMVTPPKGDFASVPLNPQGQQVANTWDTSKDGSCLAYGAAGLMRNPTRLHITWENDSTLKVETDAGQQTRRFAFGASVPPGAARTLQGFSRAEWERSGGRGAGRAQGPGAGDLKVVTTNLSAGWLRKNGVPYSENTVLTEYYDRFPTPNGEEWLVVTTVVTDPMYLTADFITSTHFRREANAAKWDPTPCKAS